MYLSEENRSIFLTMYYEIMFYVNKKFKVVEDFSTIDEMLHSGSKNMMIINSKVVENMACLKDFINQNRGDIFDEYLDLVQDWKDNYIHGEFYIERHLKKHTIFIQGNNVYGVLGLDTPIEDIFPKERLPVLVTTTLLPLDGKLISTGFYSSDNLYFGSNTKRVLKERYLRAKQNNRIIECVDDLKNPYIPKREIKNKEMLEETLDLLSETAKKLKSSRSNPASLAPAFKLIKESIDIAKLLMSDEKDGDFVYERIRKTYKQFKNIGDAVDRDVYYE